MSRQLRLIAFAACLAVHSLTSQAQAQDDARMSMSVEQSARLATRWFEEGRIDEARRLLVLMKRSALRHPQLDFLEAQLAVHDADLAGAIQIFRRLLSADPTLVRVRLELARTLFLARDFDAARYHFEIALGERDLPDSTRANIRGFLRRISAQISTFRFSVMLVPDSNVNQATSANEINILGRTYALNEDARARRALGVALFAESRHAFGPEHRSFVRSYFEHRDYPERHADFTYGQASLGHSFFLGDSTLSAELGPHTSIYQGVRLYSGRSCVGVRGRSS